MPVAAPISDPRERWHPARLIPTAGIKGQQEQERRAASALLAVMMAVPEFSAGLLKHCGAPKGRVSTYVEVQLLDKDGGKHIPDGVIVVERGQTKWQALVEFKTGTGELTTEQVTRYMDMAREHGFDAVITVSNRITASPEDLPFTVDGRKLRSTPVRHLSWWSIITEAIIQYRHRGVSDPDQAWILGELIAYLDHENSGAAGFEDMGDKWTRVRDDAKHETLRPTDPDVREVAGRWEQFIDYIALGLSQELGRDVVPVRPRKSTLDERLTAIVRELGADGKLTAALKIPDTIAPLQIEANLRTRRVTTSVEVAAPKEGRPQTRINWILKQLKTAPADLRIDVCFAGSRETASLLAGQAVEHPDQLLSPSNPKREPRTFTLALGAKMGQKRGKVPGSFVGDTKQQTLAFYSDLVQKLQAWTPKAPRLGDTPVEREVPTAGEDGGGINFRDEAFVVAPVTAHATGDQGLPVASGSVINHTGRTPSDGINEPTNA
ncbi:MAG: stress response protein [Thermoleophilia bacterium]|nr:stress response protein [Thermoleophilia bacterium]